MKSRRILRIASSAVVSGALALAITTAVGTAAAARTTSHAQQANKSKIALVPGGPNVYFSPWDKAASFAQTVFDLNKASYVVPPTITFATAVQVNTLNSLVSKGYNGFAIFPDGATAMQPTYQRMVNAGAAVIDLAGCTKQPTPALFCLATDVQKAARIQTNLVIKKMGGKGNIVFLAGEPTDANTIQRENGVKQAIAATHGKVKLLQIVAGIDSPSAAAPAIQSLLASKASQIDGIVSTSYYPSVAGAEIWQKNPQYRRIVFIGADNNPHVIKAIQDGAIYGSIFQNSEGQGVVAAYLLNKIVNDGCKVNPKGPWTKTALTDRLFPTGIEFINKTNVQQVVGKTYGLPANTFHLLEIANNYLTCG